VIIHVLHCLYILVYNSFRRDLLGQGGKVQVARFEPLPAQLVPPNRGAGFVHVLDLSFVPVAHVTEHEPHALHDVQTPLTKNVKIDLSNFDLF